MTGFEILGAAILALPFVILTGWMAIDDLAGCVMIVGGVALFAALMFLGSYLVVGGTL